MSQSLVQLRSVVLMECRNRLRRTSTWALFVLLCVVAFFLMPDTGFNSVSFLLGDRRVLMNSAATSLTSALLGGLVLSLLGYYLLSNSVSRDLWGGVGRMIAASPISTAVYLAGKLLGNVFFLTVICFVFMIACMSVHLLRGEGPLEPLVFAGTFGLMFLPMIPCVASFAILFECIGFLRGRAGDLLYFCLWVVLLALPAATVGAGNENAWLLFADVSGAAFFIKEIVRVCGTTHFTIGYAPYDATLPPAIFAGLDWNPAFVIPRLLSLGVAVPLLGMAIVAFRRFDPAAGAGRSADSGWFGRFRRATSSGRLHALIPHSGWVIGSPSFMRAVLLDVRLSTAISPALLLLISSTLLATLLAPLETVRAAILPVMFALLIPALANIPCRDKTSNTATLILAAPHMRREYVPMKFLSALVLSMIVALVPIVRISVNDPFGGLALVTGLVFIAATATFLGIVTGTPKTFGVLFLLFLYVSISSRTEPALDFAGCGGMASPNVMASYTISALMMVAAAWAGHFWSQTKRGQAFGP